MMVVVNWLVEKNKYWVRETGPTTAQTQHMAVVLREQQLILTVTVTDRLGLRF